MTNLLLASSDLQNAMIKSAIKEQLGSEVFNKLDIKELPAKSLSPMEMVDEIVKIIGDVEILVVYGAPVTEKVIDAGKKLKLIVSARGGPVNVDLETAEKKGILVSNAPGHNAEAVADHTFGLLLAEVRNIVRGHVAIKDGLWTTHGSIRFQPSEMNGKTIGIVGFGNIGPLVAKRANGFGLRILVYDPYVSDDQVESIGGKKVDFDVVLREADFITVHVRLTQETYHMFGEKEFNSMKPSVIFINASRGPAVDEKAVYEALKNKRIAGAGLDVFETEPIAANNPLLTLKNVTLTPHIAWEGTAFSRGANMAAEEIGRYLKGQSLKYLARAEQYVFEREMYDKIFKGRPIR